MADLDQQLARRRAINHARQGGKWYSVDRKRVVNVDVRGKIVAYLTEHGPSNTTTIREALTMQSNAVSCALCIGCDNGIFVRVHGANKRSYLYALPSQVEFVEAPKPAKKESHTERIAPPSYLHQRARDELAEIDRMVAGRRK